MLRVSILGSGDAFYSAGSLHSCYLLEAGAASLMLECGSSALASLKRADVDTDKPEAILISHLHGDHFGGIPYFMLEYRFRNPRTRPLTIAGPPGLEERVAELYSALYKDIPRCEPTFELRYVTVERDTRFDLAGFSVEAFEVPHSAKPFCLGYRLSAGGVNMLFSGDSAWTNEFVRRSRDTELFLCECCSVEPEAPVHTCYRDIVAHRDKLGCRRLVLTHLGADVRASDEVSTELAHDGMVIELGK